MDFFPTHGYARNDDGVGSLQKSSLPPLSGAKFESTSVFDMSSKRRTGLFVLNEVRS